MLFRKWWGVSLQSSKKKKKEQPLIWKTALQLSLKTQRFKVGQDNKNALDATTEIIVLCLSSETCRCVVAISIQLIFAWQICDPWRDWQNGEIQKTEKKENVQLETRLIDDLKLHYGNNEHVHCWLKDLFSLSVFSACCLRCLFASVGLRAIQRSDSCQRLMQLVCEFPDLVRT